MIPARFHILAGLLAGLALADAPSARAQPPIMTQRDGQSDTVHAFYLPAEQLARCPRWDGEGEPPLSLAAALDVAFEHARTQHPDRNLDAMESFSITYAQLPGMPADGGRHWYAQVSLRAWSRAAGYRNAEAWVTVRLLMDGSLWEPVVEPAPAPAPELGE